MALISTKRKTEVRCNHSCTVLGDWGGSVEGGESKSAVLVSPCPGDWAGTPFSTGNLESGVTECSPAGLERGAEATAVVSAKTKVPRIARDDNGERGGQGKMLEGRNPSSYSTTSGA